MDDRNDWCFACGSKNPMSLGLTFREENNTYITHFTAGPEHQGYNGIVHGGIISTLLDETMARYVYMKGFDAVTARLEVRFRQPTPIGQELTVTGRITRQRGTLYELSGNVALSDGTITAEGKTTVKVVEGANK